jgi:hypothetical protein
MRQPKRCTDIIREGAEEEAFAYVNGSKQPGVGAAQPWQVLVRGGRREAPASIEVKGEGAREGALGQATELRNQCVLKKAHMISDPLGSPGQ